MVPPDCIFLFDTVMTLHLFGWNFSSQVLDHSCRLSRSLCRLFLSSSDLISLYTGVSKWAGTFTRLRSCIVPVEITEPPKKLAVVKTTGTIGLWNIFHNKLMITSIAEFSHSNRTTAFNHDQVDGIFPVLKITVP